MNEVAKVTVPTAAPITKLPIIAGGNVTAIVPKSIDEAFRVAEAVCVSGMVPDSYKGATNKETASRVMIGIMKGMEVGLPPITALSNIYIVNNRPSIWGDAALALVQHHAEYAGCLEKIDGKPETDGFTATCEIKRKTLSSELITTTRTFSWADAKRAALVNKGPWRQYPQRMLQMRARAWCIRDSFADALSGLQIREEIEDMPTKPEQVDTAFLDAGETAAIPQVSTAAEMQPEADFDPQAMLDSIKKAFLAAGDDKEQNRQAIEAADTVELPEPQGTELRELVATKKARFHIR
jgi:hypothetical protein